MTTGTGIQDAKGHHPDAISYPVGDLSTAPDSVLRRCGGHFGSELSEDAIDASAESSGTGDDADRNEGSDQAIFNGSRAGFVFEET